MEWKNEGKLSASVPAIADTALPHVCCRLWTRTHKTQGTARTQALPRQHASCQRFFRGARPVLLEAKSGLL